MNFDKTQSNKDEVYKR